eukprot:TRINITY_DN5160_c0_g1_i1.p1 TRINITY_DN5160_c0_g1~~TRINITY_DN5160_c0_g1_i1.p1  ORF type:complete len:136 (+),score=13.43 TRINITY_DN5160_c0_g1_i1:63-470(+)
MNETEDRKQENMNTKFLLILFLSWILGALFRYSILFPLRLLVLMKTVLFTLAQFWLWDKVFPNDPQTLERWKLWSIELLVQILMRYGVIYDEYKDVMAPRKENEIYVVSLYYPCTQKRIYSCVIRDLKISFALCG